MRGNDRESAALLRWVGVGLGTASPAAYVQFDTLNWDRLFRVALQHGVMPLLDRGLSAASAPLPAAARYRRLALIAHLRERGLRLTAELGDVLCALDGRGVRAVPLKGPALAATLYGDVAARQFNDLDVLVRPEDRALAGDVLHGHGYRFKPAGDSAWAGIRATPRGDVSLDLHWDFAEPQYRFPMDARFWSRLERFVIGGAATWKPSAADQLLLLCGHAATHSWSRLGWIADIARFVQLQNRGFDWDATLERAREVGGLRVLLVGAQLAEALLGSRMPHAVARAARAEPVTRSLATELQSRVLLDAGEPRRLTGSYGLVESAWLYVRSRERIADRTAYGRYLLRLARTVPPFTPNDQDRGALPLPAPLTFLYYVVRPVRLAAKYGRTLARWQWRSLGRNVSDAGV